ncbi:MAG: Asp23/Gls24 family envelope stress response protein [Clostridia bacterium]|nr:Asp23/Gls24 family envelope stress response protein [Clostridia bacterium]
MAVKTNNIYGKILISDNTIERFVSRVAEDCYGIVSFVPSSLWDRIVGFFRFRTYVTGVKCRTQGDRVFIDVAVTVKYGVSIRAVVDALKSSIKYRVEKFTGMIVDTMNVKVVGVKK